MIFIDSGAFYARYRAIDQHHRAASRGWNWINTHRPRCYTSNLVVAEALNLLAYDIGPAATAERGRRILSSPLLSVLRPDTEDEFRALDLLAKYGDQRVSFVDCVSFVLMTRYELRRAFSFDRDFEMAGFERWPGKETK